MTELKLHCFFCAQRLTEQKTPGRWACAACGAFFQAERDSDGCIVRLEVSSCGTPECCREKKVEPFA